MLFKNMIYRYIKTFFLVTSIIFFATPCGAEIIIRDVWARASSAKNDTASMYFTIENNGKDDDTLTGIDTDISEEVMIHKTVITTIEGKQRVHMRMLTKLDLPSEKVIVFAPLGYHLMLSRLNSVLVAGQSFRATFRFARHAPMALDVIIEEAGADKYMHEEH